MPMTFPELTEVEGRIAERQKRVADLLAEAKNDRGELDPKLVKSTSDFVGDVRALNDELADLAVKRADLREVAKAAEANAQWDASGRADLGPGEPGGGEPRGRKSVGELFAESKAGTDLKGRDVELPDFDLKATFDTATGWAPETTRGPRVVDFATRPLELLDLIPTVPTGQAAITYMEETTFTNAAAETAEGATKPEAALALTERPSPVRKIPVWIPVTDETLEDTPRVMAYLNNRLPFMVYQRLEGQIIAGNGTAPNLRGVLNTAGIQTQAKGTDPVPDAVLKAATKVRVVGQAMPDAAVFHPYDWQDIRLLRTADGIYIWGNPSEAGPPFIWGLRALQVQAMTENTAVVGDWGNFSELAMRKGMTVKVSDSHADFFVTNKQAVRAEIRAAVTFYRPAAFCSVTGI